MELDCPPPWWALLWAKGDDHMDNQCLKHFPVTLFASVMGMTGLSIAYLRFAQWYGFAEIIGMGLAVFSFALFLAIGVTYAVKYIAYRDEVSKEFQHPIRANFFPAISISLLLLAVVSLDFYRSFAQVLWATGALLQLIFTVIIISRWIARSFEIAHSNPTWFIPVVGTIIVPIAGVEFADRELLWFFYSVGVFFWLALFTIIFYRLIFHPQLPQKFVPTLFILIAPPALGCISYMKLTGTFDIAARILLYVALFFVLLLGSMARYFSGLKFFVSWWAYTFPLCGATIATILAAKAANSTALSFVATALLAATSIVIAIVLAKTISALYSGKLCEAEE